MHHDKGCLRKGYEIQTVSLTEEAQLVALERLSRIGFTHFRRIIPQELLDRAQNLIDLAEYP